jgi:hypothetical protein
MRANENYASDETKILEDAFAFRESILRQMLIVSHVSGTYLSRYEKEEYSDMNQLRIRGFNQQQQDAL